VVLLVLLVSWRGRVQSEEGWPPGSPSAAAGAVDAAAGVAGDHPGFLFGRVTTRTGGRFAGRLRWGGGEEAFWGDYFNGEKKENPWVAHVPDDRLPRESSRTVIFGIEIANRERKRDLSRLFMARFGDIARLEAEGTDVRVTLKSGTVAVLDRLEASDFDDGVRVWDAERGTVDLDSTRIRSIEFLPTAPLTAVPGRLHGTVHTARGAFTGFLQWNREACVGSDELAGRGEAGEVRLRFDSLRALARHGRDASRVTLADGSEILLTGGRDVGQDNRGVYVDDPRYGRVLVSWDAFERVEFSAAGEHGSGPGYDDFPPGRPLAGSVTARDGRRLEGRLVFDLDESETTETLDAPKRGVDYTLPFALVAAIVPAGNGDPEPRRARVTLRSGEELALEPAGDLGPGNAGLLVFSEGSARPAYLPWPDVARIDLTPPPPPAPPTVRP